MCKQIHWVLLALETGTHMLKGIIIHSKYFPNSDWLKVDAWFTITSYWWPNLEEFCVYWGNDVKNAAHYRLRHCYREELGTRLSCFGCENKNGGHYNHFKSEITTAGTRRNNSWNIAKTARRQLGRWHLLFGEYLWSWTNLNVHYRRWTYHQCR